MTYNEPNTNANRDLAIRVRGLHVKLGNAHILRGIDLDVARGKTVAILGANGSGKSTLIRAIVNVLPRSEGSIELFGTSLDRRRAVPWDRVGYAPQRMSVDSGVPATALETVKSGLIYGRKLRYGRDAIEKAKRALDLVGLLHRASHSVQTFSGGQQQRVLIARALVKNPDLLVLDEPFAGVDRTSREHITAVLRTLRERGTTIILILHELYELEDLIDESYTISHGTVVDHILDAHAVRGYGEHAHADHDHQHAHEAKAPHYITPSMKGAM